MSPREVTVQLVMASLTDPGGRERNEDSLRCIMRALDLDPRSPVYRTGFGRILAKLGHRIEAADAYRLALVADSSFAEAFALLRKSGVDEAKFLEIMAGSFFQSPIYENYGKIIAEQRYEPAGFKLHLGLKDIRLIMAAAEEAGAPMPIASLIRDNLISGIAQGFGDLDWAAVARVAALKSGLKS